MISSPRILIVDDEPGMRHALVRLMQTAGYAVLEAATGQEALRQVRESRPDLVLLDVRLPDIDGLDVLKQIKSDPVSADTFVVHLTAQRCEPEYTKEGLRRGADGYLVQPIDSGELLARVQAFLRHKETLDQLKTSEARYRAMFERSPQAIWIYDGGTKRFIMANPAAMAHYGYNLEEFSEMTLDDIVIGCDRPETLPVATIARYEEQHRTRDGRIIDVQVTEHEVTWRDKPGIVSLIVDVTERKQAERDRDELIERCRREIRALEQMTNAGAQPSTADSLERSLKERLPAVFDGSVSVYAAILDAAVDERVYKVEHDVSEKLRALASRLARVRATPRDIVQIHFTSMQQRVSEPGAPRAQGFIEAGRTIIVEVMGYLAMAYRDAVPAQVAAAGS